MNVKSLITVNYQNWTLGHIGQTNPIQTQTNPKQTQFYSTLPDAQMNVTAFNTMNYQQGTMKPELKTNPNKPKSPPCPKIPSDIVIHEQGHIMTYRAAARRLLTKKNTTQIRKDITSLTRQNNG
jgi:hypothetical protein